MLSLKKSTLQSNKIDCLSTAKDNKDCSSWANCSKIALSREKKSIKSLESAHKFSKLKKKKEKK